MNIAADLYLAYWDDVLVGMNAVLNVPSGCFKHYHRSHRLVVLPDYQGLGAGTKINDFIGEYYKNMGHRYCMHTSHVRLIEHLKKSKKWIPTASNDTDNLSIINHTQNTLLWREQPSHKMLSRVCASYEYVGEEYNEKPHYDMFINQFDEKYTMKLIDELKLLKQTHYVTVYHGIVSEDDVVDEICQSLGIRVLPLYFRRDGVYVIKSKYAGENIINYTDNESELKNYNEQLNYNKFVWDI